MSAITLQRSLGALRSQVKALQCLADVDSGAAIQLSSQALDGLRQSLQALEQDLTEHSAAGRLEARAIAPEEAATRGLDLHSGLQEIRESESRKAAIIDASLDAVITIDQHARVVEFNAAAEAIFGYRRADVLGREILGLIVPHRMREQAATAYAIFRASRAGGPTRRRFEAFAMRSDGSELPVEVVVAPIGSGVRPLITIYVCDATERKGAQESVKQYQSRLRSLMAELLIAEEHERRRLAIDLHDGLSQTIALTQIKLRTLRTGLRGKFGKELQEIEDLIRQAGTTSRSISFELSPPVLHDLGLEPALRWLVENIRERYGIEIRFEGDGRPTPADADSRVILFRSIRELLINAAKHAKSKLVRLRLEREDDDLIVVVEDDGVGMEPDSMERNGSGLFSINERLEHVGGSMHIDSSPGRGTRVCLRAPLRKKCATTMEARA
jgi:PAS domain S-box-containing protein